MRLEEQVIKNFFESAIESGVDAKAGNQFLSVLLENRADSRGIELKKKFIYVKKSIVLMMKIG